CADGVGPRARRGPVRVAPPAVAGLGAPPGVAVGAVGLWCRVVAGAALGAVPPPRRRRCQEVVPAPRPQARRLARGLWLGDGRRPRRTSEKVGSLRGEGGARRRPCSTCRGAAARTPPASCGAGSPTSAEGPRW